MPTHSRLTKRSLFVTGGASFTLALMPWSIRSALAQEGFDVIVVGGGTAGMPTAIAAAERGARVLILEKSSQLGGTMDRSSGQIAAAGTVFQKSKGIEDSPEAHYDDMMRINKNTSDPSLSRLWADHGGAAINWLAENGFTVADDLPVKGLGHEAYTVARYLWGPDGAKSIYEVMQPLIDAHVRTGLITLVMNAQAVELIQDHTGAVSGVVAEDDRGNRSDYRGRSIVLASGGCAANPSMFEDLHGVPLYWQAAHPNSQGAGLMLGRAVGGWIRGGEKYLGTSSGIVEDYFFPSPLRGFMTHDPIRRPPWEIWLNTRGKRFVREDHESIDHRERALLEQPGHRFWVVFDQTIIEQAPSLFLGSRSEPTRTGFDERHPMFMTAQTLGELGVKTGIDPLALQQTVNDYNHRQTNNLDDPLGRKHRPSPITSPPFYAIRVQGGSLISFAGLAVDGGLRVIRDSGAPVPNLYAVGEVLGAGATTGNAYVGGAMVTPAVTFGRLLGRELLPLST